MPSHSLTFLFIFASLVLGGYRIVSAAPQTYEEYKLESMKYCDSNERSWSTAKSLAPKIDYSEFATSAINATLSNWRAG